MRLSLVLISTLSLLLPAEAAPRLNPGKPLQRPRPNTVVFEPKRMVHTARDVSMGNYADELSELLSHADPYLSKGPWSVTNKKMPVPDGTPNDYASQAPYWWPANWNNPSSTVKCPYVQRDGIRNPEVDQYTDRRDSFEMMNSVYILSLAWWHTDKPEYRRKCGEVLRTWFINPATAMTPHLLHAQIQPCKNSGRAIGIIDFAQQYTDVVDAAALLDVYHDDSWSDADSEAFKNWNRQYLDWLKNSAFGTTELAAKNNHGTFAAMQIAAISAWLGDTGTAASQLSAQRDLIADRIDDDGSQPQEIIRPTSYHYSTFTLVAWLRMVAIGQRVGVDLWGYTGPDGQSIPKAVEYILDAAQGGDWPHEEINMKRFAAYDIVRFAADMGMADAQSAIPNLEKAPTGAYWNLAPAVQQLDSILLDQVQV